MRKFCLPLAALAVILSVCDRAAAGTDPADTHPDLHLIPWPKALERGTGHLTLTAESRIAAGTDTLKPRAGVLADEIATLTGLKLPVAAGPARAGDIVLTVNPELKAGEPILMLRDREPVRTKDGAHAIAVTDRAV